jgi:hypothetical protein
VQVRRFYVGAWQISTLCCAQTRWQSWWAELTGLLATAPKLLQWKGNRVQVQVTHRCAGQCWAWSLTIRMAFKRGQVLDLPDEMALRMIKQGQVQSNWRDEPGPPYVAGYID